MTAPFAFPSGLPDLAATTAVALFLLGWVAGSFPAAVVVGRLVGIDVLHGGEGNPGSANVWKLAGPGPGIAVLLLDLSKGIVPGLIGWAVAGYWGAVIGALGGVVGAVRPIVPGLRGGRGVGAAAGAGLVIQPVAGLVAFAVAIAVAVATRRPATATAIGFAAYPIAWAVLGVRSVDTLVPLAGAGLIALVALARWLLTRR
jgi:acyl phosphate:glycerol-3-phosphate acyltransferase